MESCIYGGFLVGLINHQSEKSVQTEPPFLETYFVKDFFDTVNKQNICFERLNPKAESLNSIRHEKTTEEFTQKNETNSNGIDFTFFEEQFKAHLNSLKPYEQANNTANDVEILASSDDKKIPKVDNNKKTSLSSKYIKVDLKEKRYRCETCNKRFVNSSDFKRHLKIHTDEKLYVCTVCNKGKNFCSFRRVYFYI